MPISILFWLLTGTVAFGQTPANTTTSVPAATQWLYDAVAPGSKGTVDSVVRIGAGKPTPSAAGSFWTQATSLQTITSFKAVPPLILKL
jgi:hypothetical protein